ncbi:hypothetical protein [Thalassospira lucentensis]|uniref:hypothetical protein n=1 Tax=Thalassospira lucentensis TaxID=168935 RepID=UPI0029431807|nr:hypothetical protein [Thalassospira lucentensis]WOI12203.1 hypothetical protein R1T41_06350 [Thalassospira lucentensis]
MIPEYEKTLKEITSPLSSIGFEMKTNTDFKAVFMSDGGWKILLEGDRYYRPLIEITISPPHDNSEYSLRIIIKCYETIEKEKQLPPTAINQVEFLLKNFHSWVKNTQTYKSTYDKLNA